MAVAGMGSGSTNFFSGGVCGTLEPADPFVAEWGFPGGCGFADAVDAYKGTPISPAPPPTKAFRSRARRLTPLPIGLLPAPGEPCESLASTNFPFRTHGDRALREEDGDSTCPRHEAPTSPAPHGRRSADGSPKRRTRWG